MPPTYFPLRWESTGDQWWYASPIDWAAANGHYDLVRELLRIDANLLIKLTSLRRIRRLESVWDDDAQFFDVANCRSSVARSLLLECETKKGKNTLIRAGYGGWLLYTAASAGDITFTQDILRRDPHLVFGEGEYGVTDIFYAAARSKRSEVFRLLFDYAVSPRGSAGESDGCITEVPKVLRWEMTNRAVHAAARGGNLEILRELLRDGSDVLSYRDSQGCTLLHTAAGRGQVEVVKDLVKYSDIITCKDNHGNTSLHVAAYRGHLGVVDSLIQAFPLLACSSNNAGDTFLHLAIAGFKTPGFQRLDRQIELIRQLVSGKILNLQGTINLRNNEGRTALHMAVIGNIDSNLVELLMSVPQIDINIRDVHDMTPLDLLKQHPRSTSSEILIKQLTSAGGVLNSEDSMARRAIASCLKMRCPVGGSPGTSFGIPDAEIFLPTGAENASDASGDQGSGNSCTSTSMSEPFRFQTISSAGNDKPNSANCAARRLKILIGWPHKKWKKTSHNLADSSEGPKEGDLLKPSKKPSMLDGKPIPLRQRFSKPPLLPNNKRTLDERSNTPSPLSKKKFAAGLVQGVIQAMPHLAFASHSSTPLSGSSRPSPAPDHKRKGIVFDDEIDGASCSKTPATDGTPGVSPKPRSANTSRLMNHYFCLGAQGLSAQDSIVERQGERAFKHSVLSVAG